MPTSTGVPISNIKNVTDNTLKKYEKRRWISLVPNYTKYVGYILYDSGMKYAKEITGNMPMQWQVQVAGINNTVAIGAYSQIALGDNTISATAQVEARNIITHFTMDILEKRAQQGGLMLIDLIDEKYNAMMESHVERVEGYIWGCPAQSDALTPYGFPTWIVKYADADATPTAGGFLGTFPYGSDNAVYTSAPNGLSPSLYSRAGNWAAKYSAVSFDDFVLKLTTACDKTNFQAPSPYAQLVKDEPDSNDTLSRAAYFNLDVKQGLNKLARLQNSDNATGDLAWFDGRTKIRGREGVYVPFLDADTSDPCYLINHDACPFLKDPAHQGGAITNGLERVSVEQPTTLAKVYMWIMGTAGIRRDQLAVLSTKSKQGN